MPIIQLSAPMIPASTLVVDLISYDGSPDKTRLSPYPGMLQELRNQIRVRGGESIDIRDMMDYIRDQKDYSCKAQKPQPGPYVRREPGTPEPTTWLTRLEDIDSSWVEEYVIDSMIGYKRNAGGRSKQLRTTRGNVVFADEDGALTDETELETDSDNTSRYDIVEAKTKLPHLLKRLHLKSKTLGCSLISLYGTYLRLQHEGAANPKPGALLSPPNKIWRMDADGNITTPYPPSANHTVGFPEALKFVSGQVPNDPFYKDLLEMKHVCDALGISLWLEDPKKFDQAFIDSLLVTYVKSNTDFLWNGRPKDSHILDAIHDSSKADWSSPGSQVYNRDNVQSFLLRVEDSRSAELRSVVNMTCTDQLFDYFFSLYKILSQDADFVVSGRTYCRCNPGASYAEERVPNMRCMSTAYRFLCLNGSAQPYSFKVGPICMGRPYSTAILHESGNLFIVSNTRQVFVLHISKAVEYIKVCIQMKDRALGSPIGEDGMCGKWNTLML